MQGSAFNLSYKANSLSHNQTLQSRSPKGNASPRIAPRGKPNSQEDLLNKTQPTITYKHKDDTHNKPQTCKPSNLAPFLKKDHRILPKQQGPSPTPVPRSPHYHVSGMRHTVKAVVQKVPSFESNPKSPVGESSRRVLVGQQISELLGTVSSTQGSRSERLMQMQIEILREENQLLRRQLEQIKRSLLDQRPSRRQQTILSMRETVKKEDTTVQQLKLKLEVAHQQLEVQRKTLQVKEHQLETHKNQIQRMHDADEHSQQLQTLQQRVSAVCRAYAELQWKWQSAEWEWRSLRQAWEQEKSIYMHRIHFLEHYLSNQS